MSIVMIPKQYFILLILILMILLFVFANKLNDQLCLECIFKKEEFQQMKKEKSSEEEIPKINSEPIFGPNTGMRIAPLSTKLGKDIDRVYHPNQYPYKSPDFYDQSWYPNLKLPFQVLGGGRRMTPTLGGTQVAMLNPPAPIDISDDNIAPNNIMVVNPNKYKEQIGVLYKIFGSNNEIYPLYRTPARRNMNQYNYYTRQGPYGVQVPVVTKNKTDELDTNDVVFLKGLPGSYRVTIYSDDLPSYVSTAF
jgi:hypothetical protein